MVSPSPYLYSINLAECRAHDDRIFAFKVSKNIVACTISFHIFKTRNV